jgi:hypothetical protein
MEGLDTAFIGWSLAGDTPVGSVSMVRKHSATHLALTHQPTESTARAPRQQLCKSALTLNLITGRVLKQRDSWCASLTAAVRGAPLR